MRRSLSLLTTTSTSRTAVRTIPIPSTSTSRARTSAVRSIQARTVTRSSARWEVVVIRRRACTVDGRGILTGGRGHHVLRRKRRDLTTASRSSTVGRVCRVRASPWSLLLLLLLRLSDGVRAPGGHVDGEVGVAACDGRCSRHGAHRRVRDTTAGSMGALVVVGLHVRVRGGSGCIRFRGGGEDPTTGLVVANPPEKAISAYPRKSAKLQRTLIIQFETWLMLRPVSEHNHFFSSSVGYGCSVCANNHFFKNSVTGFGNLPRRRCCCCATGGGKLPLPFPRPTGGPPRPGD